MATDDHEAPTDIADLIVRDCCELDPADTEHPSTLCIRVEDLQMILHVHLAPPAAALAAPPVEQQAARLQYYYKVNGCPAPLSKSPGCICWHDKGTGPRANDPGHGLTWRATPPAPTEPAPQAGAAKFDCLPAILGDLRHSARVDGYTEDQRGFMEAMAVRLETRINAMSGPLPAPAAHPTEQPSQDANARRWRWALAESPEWTYAVCKWDGRDWLPINTEADISELDAARAAQAQGEKGKA